MSALEELKAEVMRFVGSVDAFLASHGTVHPDLVADVERLRRAIAPDAERSDPGSTHTEQETM